MTVSQKELQAFCDNWANDNYQHRKHGGLNGVSPWEKAASWNQPIARINNERALDILLAPIAGERIVGKKGIRLGNSFYVSPALAGHEGCMVKLCWDDNEAAAVYVFSMEGEFIAHAINPDMWEGLSRAELKTVDTEIVGGIIGCFAVAGLFLFVMRRKKQMASYFSLKVEQELAQKLVGVEPGAERDLIIYTHYNNLIDDLKTHAQCVAVTTKVKELPAGYFADDSHKLLLISKLKKAEIKLYDR